MKNAVFVSDLHGNAERYEKLFRLVREETPEILFIGGDVLPSAGMRGDSAGPTGENFIFGVLRKGFRDALEALGEHFPAVFMIMGNDDPRCFESSLTAAGDGLWTYLHGRTAVWKGLTLAGYNYVPPTPFLLKDWERYDISRYTDPGCTSPEYGTRTFPVRDDDKIWTTIREDLETLTRGIDSKDLVMLLHSPPYGTPLDLAGLEGKYIDHVPLDPHVGSIAVKRFIDEKQPHLTMHGHIHEAAALSGGWMLKTGRTVSFNAATDKAGMLCIIRFNIFDPADAEHFIL